MPFNDEQTTKKLLLARAERLRTYWKRRMTKTTSGTWAWHEMNREMLRAHEDAVRIEDSIRRDEQGGSLLDDFVKPAIETPGVAGTMLYKHADGCYSCTDLACFDAEPEEVPVSNPQLRHKEVAQVLEAKLADASERHYRTYICRSTRRR